MVRNWAPLSHDEITAWIEARKGRLPKSLDEVSRYPMDVRAMVAAALTAEERTNLWREHISTFLTGPLELSADQREAVQYAYDHIGEAVGSMDKEVASQIEDRVKKSFGQTRLAYQLCCEIGPSEPIGGMTMPKDD